MGNVLNLKPWPKGVSGNPAGRPRGGRSKLTEAFLVELAEDFETAGKEAIIQARTKDPMGYVRMVAGLCPKELDVRRPLQDLTDEQLATALDALRSFIASAIDGTSSSEGAGDEGEPA